VAKEVRLIGGWSDAVQMISHLPIRAATKDNPDHPKASEHSQGGNSSNEPHV
jgi:hypothetical protein